MRQSVPKKDATKQPSRVPTTGLVEDDGALVELLYDPQKRQTVLAVCRDGQWSVAREVQSASGERLVPYRPSNPLIRDQVVLLPSAPVECGSTAELASEIRSYLHRYIDLSPDFETAVVTYVLLSWVYDAFNELPYLRVRGDYGTGKTRFLLVAGALFYKAFFGSGASTVSPLFHIQDAFRGTMVFDEADFRFSDEKAEVVKILNNGNVAGMPVLRTMPNGKGELQPRAFQVFGPKVIASRGAYDDRALESRFITARMGEGPLRGDIPINLPDQYRDEALALRNKLLVHRFRNRHRVVVNPDLVAEGLDPRRNQILVPLLSVAPNEDMRTAINSLVHGQVDRERGENVELRLLAIVRYLAKQYPGKGVPIAAVTEALRARGGVGFSSVGPRYVGSLVRGRLGLVTAKRHGVYVIPLEELAKLPREVIPPADDTEAAGGKSSTPGGDGGHGDVGRRQTGPGDAAPFAP